MQLEVLLQTFSELVPEVGISHDNHEEIEQQQRPELARHELNVDEGQLCNHGAGKIRSSDRHVRLIDELGTGGVGRHSHLVAGTAAQQGCGGG